MKKSLSTIALSFFIMQNSFGADDEKPSCQQCSQDSPRKTKNCPELFNPEAYNISQEDLLKYYNDQKNKPTSYTDAQDKSLQQYNDQKSQSDEILRLRMLLGEQESKIHEMNRLHQIVSQQAEELEKKDEKIKVLERVPPSPTVVSVTPYPPYNPFQTIKQNDKEKQLLEEKYKKSLAESVESYRQASELLDSNQQLESELEQERERFIKAKQAQDNANAEKQRQEEARRAQERQNNTTAKHLEQSSKQVVKEAARVVHNAGNAGKNIFKRF